MTKNTTKLSQLQRRLLQYLAEREGLKLRRPASPVSGLLVVYDSVEDNFADLAETLSKGRILRYGTKWASRDFYDHTPTASERAAVSRAMARLEDRGLVVTYRTKGKLERVTHAKLTHKGREVVADMFTTNG